MVQDHFANKISIVLYTVGENTNVEDIESKSLKNE